MSLLIKRCLLDWLLQVLSELFSTVSAELCHTTPLHMVSLLRW